MEYQFINESENGIPTEPGTYLCCKKDAHRVHVLNVEYSAENGTKKELLYTVDHDMDYDPSNYSDMLKWTKENDVRFSECISWQFRDGN